jgi:hypothetical protein
VFKWIFNSQLCFRYGSIFCIFITAHPGLFSQQFRDVPYFSNDAPAIRQKLAEEADASIRARFQVPGGFEKDAKKAYLAERDHRLEKTTEEIRQRAVVDDVLWPFLKGILKRITAVNPEATRVKVILVANPTANAYSIGEGTVVVYTGLLAGLENEDQLAFVLCHEIAHYLLEHPTKGLERDILSTHNKAFKEKIKAANSEEFNKNEHLENIIKTVFFRSRYHSRDYERQADSLAYRLFLKTAWSAGQVSRMMEVFEFIDEPLRDSTLNLSAQFGCDQYPFQKQWLNKGAGSVWSDAKSIRKAAEKSVQDSLSTHPDWKNRLAWILEMAGSQSAGAPTSNVASPSYATIRFLSVLECINAWYHRGRYDRALFYASLYQHTYKTCGYLHDIQSLSLYELYAHARDHKLATVLTQPSPDYPENLNALLSFLNSLRLKDLLGLQKCSVLATSAPDSEYGLLAAYRLADSEADQPGMLRFKTIYLRKFPNGRFADIFKPESK